MKESVQLATTISDDDVRALALFVKEQCRLEANSILDDAIGLVRDFPADPDITDRIAETISKLKRD